MKTSILIEMYVVCCSQCGVSFAIPNELDNRLRKCHNTFYCPNGHAQHYPHKTTEERLREEMAQKDRIIAAHRKEEERKRANRL